MLKNFRKILSLILFSIILFPNSLNFVKAEDNFYKPREYGLFSYSYDHIPYKYYPNAVNIGDYIQSLAARQFFPNSCKEILIDRDKLGCYKGPKVKMIMNSWYLINEKNKAFSNNIDPIFVSLHINNAEDITQETVDYLKKHEPIGCRDYSTQVVLAKKGVKTYFSSCLTTTLDEKYKAKDSERNDNIIFCDYKFGDYPEADKYLKSLKGYKFEKAIYTYHENLSKTSTHEERFKIAEDLLKKYARAQLVITTRIHCALPCLALGTPVILVKQNYDNKRFGGLYDLMNTIGKNNQGDFEIKVNRDKNGKVFNSQNYLKYAQKLKSTIRKILSN